MTCACGTTAYAHVLSGRYDRSGAHDYPFEIVECVGCGLERTIPSPDTSQYVNGYALANGGVGDSWSGRVAAHVAARMDGRRLLDVGCHVGALVQEAATRGLDAEGIDIDPLAVEAGRAAGRRVRLSRLDEVEGTYDAVVLNHVLEHVAELGPFLRDAARVLRPGGRLFVFAPNHSGPVPALMGASWVGLVPHMHVWHFTPKTLVRTVEALAPLRSLGYTTRGVIEPSSAGARGVGKTLFLRAAKAARRGDQIEAVFERAG